MVRTVVLVAGVAIWNAAYVGLRDRRASSLGIDDVSRPEVFVPTFAEVVGLSGLLALVGVLLTIGVTFENRLSGSPPGET